MNGAEKASDVDFEAAAWAVRLENGDLTDAEQQRLEAWLDRDPRCVGALVRAQAVWVDLDRVVAQTPDEEKTVAAPRHRWFEPRRLAAAAAVVIAAIVGAGVYDYYDGQLSSARGEIRRVALEDGSSLILNSASVVRVRYRDGQRMVELRRGEASFQVAHDTARPFVVRAGGVAVRAVGTSFAVRLQPQEVSVVVDEGTVEVKRTEKAPAAGDAQQLVTRDETLTVQPAANMQKAKLTGREIARRLAWRDGVLIFDGQKLSEAVLEINRYAGKAIVIDDKRLADKVLVGAFRLGDSKTFADSVVAAYGAKLNERNGALHLSVR
jgi:transmembrane sensor